MVSLKNFFLNFWIIFLTSFITLILFPLYITWNKYRMYKHLTYKFMHAERLVATLCLYGLPQWLSDKESTCNAGDVSSIPGSRPPGGGNDNPLQYPCWENSWTKEPGGLWFMGSQRVEHDCTQHLCLCLMLLWWPDNKDSDLAYIYYYKKCSTI